MSDSSMMASQKLAQNRLSRPSDGRFSGMALTRIAVLNGCRNNGCPSVHATGDPAVLVVQGNRIDAATRAELGQRLPEHEDAVTIPAEVILEAARIIEAKGRSV